MVSYSKAAMERAMKVQDVILRAMAKRITWAEMCVEARDDDKMEDQAN